MMNKIIINLTFIFCIILSSCGTDSTTNPTTPAGTVLYSRDSLIVRLTPSTYASGTDSLYYSTLNSGGVKMDFTLSSNADSVHSSGNWAIYSNASPSVTVNHPINAPVDSSYQSLNLSFVSGQTTFFSLAARLTVNNSTMTHFIRLKNVKITKQ